jgi:uncharacterized damage-inducible protein DinB
MSEDNRAALTGGLWFFSALVLVALFISAAVQGELTLAHIVVTFVILALAIAGTSFLFRWNDSKTPQEKTKRRRIDNLLREMSDEELIELKQRLSDSDLSEEPIVNSLGDDGELVRRS